MATNNSAHRFLYSLVSYKNTKECIEVYLFKLKWDQIKKAYLMALVVTLVNAGFVKSMIIETWIVADNAILQDTIYRFAIDPDQLNSFRPQWYSYRNCFWLITYGNLQSEQYSPDHSLSVACNIQNVAAIDMHSKEVSWIMILASRFLTVKTF